MTPQKHTSGTIQEMRDKGEKITMLTAYDYPTARRIDEAGIDMILVGDSCAIVVHGHADSLGATMGMMVLHSAAVARGCRRAMVAADMPFGSFQYGIEETMRNAARFVTEAKVDAVKFEAAHKHIEKTRAIVEMGIAVVGHVGLPPQAIGAPDEDESVKAARKVVGEALALQEAGAFAIIIEAMPAELSAYITRKLSIPTIGIGAGPGCSGQLLVTPDMLGITNAFSGKFGKRYGNLDRQMTEVFTQYAREVKSGAFPSQEQPQAISDEIMAAVEKTFG